MQNMFVVIRGDRQYAAYPTEIQATVYATGFSDNIEVKIVECRLSPVNASQPIVSANGADAARCLAEKCLGDRSRSCGDCPYRPRT